MISAKIVADSISPRGIRLTTMELNYHRFIHSEFMTHRMFSRNASSSRAIPVEKMLKQVQEDPAIPIHWGKNQPGMQAEQELDECSKVRCKEYWSDSAKDAHYWATKFKDNGLHKQLVNRILEPYQYIKVIVTATEWENFFELRRHKAAQPEIYELAECMYEAMENSIPSELNIGQWHLPYIQEGEFTMSMFPSESQLYHNAIQCSVARCARVSYLNHDNSSPNIEKDLELANKLYTAGHMSPFEHVACPMVDTNGFMGNDVLNPYIQWERGITHMDRDGNYWSSNFRGWIQYRNMI